LAPQRPAVLYLQGEIDVNQAGAVAIDVQCSELVQVWLDAEPFEGAKRIERDFAVGRHTLTFRVAVGTGENPELRVELTKPGSSGAQFVVVNGM
jgi:hypothetical protein